MELIFLVVVIPIIGCILYFVFAAFLVKKGIDLYKKHWDAFNQAIMEQQRILQALNSGSPRASKKLMRLQFMNAQLKAQSVARQLDDLRRQKADLKMSEMRSLASQMGIPLNP